MRPPESFIGQPIRSLQTMLRVLAEHDARYAVQIPDGIYGPGTVAAVSQFQRIHGLPITGITDQITWETVVAEYEDALIHVDEAEPLHIILNANEVIRRGQSDPNLYVVQALLQVLAQAYGSIGYPSHNGVLDDATADAISTFQALVGLPMTGNLDKITWKHLVLQYPIAANRRTSWQNILTNY